MLALALAARVQTDAFSRIGDCLGARTNCRTTYTPPTSPSARASPGAGGAPEVKPRRINRAARLCGRDRDGRPAAGSTLCGVGGGILAGAPRYYAKPTIKP